MAVGDTREAKVPVTHLKNGTKDNPNKISIKSKYKSKNETYCVTHKQ